MFVFAGLKRENYSYSWDVIGGRQSLTDTPHGVGKTLPQNEVHPI